MGWHWSVCQPKYTPPVPPARTSCVLLFTVVSVSSTRLWKSGVRPPHLPICQPSAPRSCEPLCALLPIVGRFVILLHTSSTTLSSPSFPLRFALRSLHISLRGLSVAWEAPPVTEVYSGRLPQTTRVGTGPLSSRNAGTPSPSMSPTPVKPYLVSRPPSCALVGVVRNWLPVITCKRQ